MRFRDLRRPKLTTRAVAIHLSLAAKTHVTKQVFTFSLQAEFKICQLDDSEVDCTR
jgi:hypothetical protein